MPGPMTGHHLSGVPGLPDEVPDESADAFIAGAGGRGSGGLPGQHVDPGWAGRLDAHHLAIACQSSAAVLARGGRDDARVLREVAAQAQTRIDQRKHQHPEQVGGHTDDDGWPDLGLDRWWNQPAQRLAPPIDDLARGTHPAEGSGQRQEDGG